MHAHEHGIGPALFAHVTLDDGDVGVRADVVFIGDHREIAEAGGQLGFGHAAHAQLPEAQVIADEIAHGGDFEAVLFGKGLQIGHPGHGPVVLHDFADDGGGLEEGPGQILPGL